MKSNCRVFTGQKHYGLVDLYKTFTLCFFIVKNFFGNFFCPQVKKDKFKHVLVMTLPERHIKCRNGAKITPQNEGLFAK